MKIVLITHYFQPHTGGIEIVALNEARELAKRGHKITVVTSRLKNDPKEQYLDGARIVRVNAINPLEHFGVPWPIFNPIELQRTLRKIIADSDIVHAHGGIYSSSLVAAKICKKIGKPFIITEHVSLVPYNNPILSFIQKTAYGILGHKTYSNANTVFTLNNKVKAHVISHGAKPSSVRSIMNGVNTNIFKPASRKEKIALKKKLNIKNEIIVLYVGRFVEKKGYKQVLAAASDEYHTILIGSGNLPTTNDKRITILPGQSQEILAKYYQCADVFVLPSKGEGFPLNIMEAMMSAIPVITSNDPAYKEYLAGSQVITIENNSFKLKQTIESLIKNSKKRASMARAERNIAKKMFTWKRHTDALIHAYTEALS